MTPSPIRRVLSSFRRRGVRALLLGGQACILYGAAEFSRDVDFAVPCDPANLRRLRAAPHDLKARRVYVPPLEASFLRRGHACDFRCRVAAVNGLRIDILSVLRGCEPVESLWERRTAVRVPGLGRVDLLSLPDLVRSKRTQRDKDWVMARRLVESDCFRARRPVSAARLGFWLMNLIAPGPLMDLARRHRGLCRELAGARPLLRIAAAGERRKLERALGAEERAERRADARYWTPLRRELFKLRQARRKKVHGRR